jgi:hypothetical protein
MEPTQIRSSGSCSLIQTGMQEPQKRLRLMFQSLASSSQLPKRLAPTAGGTQRTLSFCATSCERRSATFTYQASMAR